MPTSRRGSHDTRQSCEGDGTWESRKRCRRRSRRSRARPLSGAEQIDSCSARWRGLEDTNAVKCLHYKYGYYIDKCLYDEAVDLFSDDGAVRFLNGLYRGKAGARRLYCHWFRNYFTKGHNGPVRGFLLDHLLFQDIVRRRAGRAHRQGPVPLRAAGGLPREPARAHSEPAEAVLGGRHL